jgi:phage tail sheath protein FI
VFEPNDKITRDELKQVIERVLNDLMAKRALTDYVVVCDESNNTPLRRDRNELYVDVAIEPIKSAEFIYVPLRIKGQGALSGS